MRIVQFKISFLRCLGCKHEANNKVPGLSRSQGQRDDRSA